MMWLRKSKKGFTLVELMVVVAIIGVLALLGLRLFLMQQVRAKNAIVKANAATVHTIIQGNLADFTYTLASDAVNAICEADGVTALSGGDGLNSERPAGMKNPHLTADTDIVVYSIDTLHADEAAFITAADALAVATYQGAAIVGGSSTANKFYVVPLDNLGLSLGEVYVAQK